MAGRIQFRRGTAAAASTANQVLANGEPGYEADTGRMKIGNGVDEWDDLPYVDNPPAGGLAGHLADTTDAHDASAISVVPTGGIAATTVQAALAELDTEKATTAALTAHLDDTTDAHDASAISLAPIAALGSPANVQDAMASLPGRFATRDQASQIDGMSIVTLISGAEDEAPITSNCTTTNDARPGAIGGRAHRMSMTGAVTGQLIFDPPGGSSDPLIYGANTHAIGLVVDIEDVSRITTITIGLFSDSGLTQQWTLAASDATAALVNGRNVLRWRPWAGVTTGWGTAWRIRIVAVTTATTNIWIENAWAEQRAKSSIVLINDSCYETFYTQGYPACQARRYPVTWAPDPGILGSFPGDPGERMTEAELAAAMASGNGDECSFHGWDSAVTATMTAAQYRTDTMRAIRWLNERGYRDGAFWRAAVTQNVANNGAGADGYMWASGTYTGQTGNHEIFPPMETRRFNLSRIAIHGLNNAQIDALFATQQQFRTLTLWYLHGIHPTASGDTTPAMWAYWLSKVDEGVAAGWLEVTTMSNLFRRMGGRFISAQGRKAIQWTDQTGTLRTQLLP
jgi:hypothetical protein